MGLLNVGFNFLVEEVSKNEYAFHAIQKETDGGEILGGETYLIRRDPRNLFMTGAGSDKTVNENQMVTIQADTINEPATPIIGMTPTATSSIPGKPFPYLLRLPKNINWKSLQTLMDTRIMMKLK